MLLLLLQSNPIAQPSPPADNINIPLWDEFDDKAGRFLNYDAHDTAQRVQLTKQRHVNIRSFENDDVLIGIPMLYLDLLPMTLLNNQRMVDIEGTTVVRAGERWSQGTVSKDASRHNWRVLTLNCQAGNNITQSVFYN